MIKYIFEDSEQSPSSKLLRSCYNGDNIYFSSGGKANKILQVVNNCRMKDEKCVIVIFFDLPPNNRYTYINYEVLLDKILTEGYVNVYVIPIICIEYYILKFLIGYNYLVPTDKQKELIKNLITGFDYKSEVVQKFVNKNSYRKNSLEHVYKELLKELAINSKCMLNKQSTENNNNFYGKFYKENCNCDRHFCRINCNDNLSLKAERLYSKLPGFVLIDETHRTLFSKMDIPVVHISLNELFDIIHRQITIICESMDVTVPLMMRYDDVNNGILN